MSHLIRHYTHQDFSMVKSWWKKSTNQEPKEDMLSTDETFILEINNVPALSITLLLTQVKGMAYLFSFIKNPLFKDVSLDEYGHILWNHCFNYAKNKGYKKLICFSDNDKLSKKYEKFGMTKTLSNLTGFIKEV